jgi:hypothetical protein
MVLQPLYCALAAFSLPWTGDQPITRPLPVQDKKNRLNSNIYVLNGIRIHGFQWGETVHVFRPAVTVIGRYYKRDI